MNTKRREHHPPLVCPGRFGEDGNSVGCGTVVHWDANAAHDSMSSGGYICPNCGAFPVVAGAQPRPDDTIRGPADVRPRLEATLTGALADPRLLDRDHAVLGAMTISGTEHTSVQVIASREWLATATGLHESAVRRSLARLERFGYLRPLDRQQMLRKVAFASTPRRGHRPPKVYEICRPPDTGQWMGDARATRAQVKDLLDRLGGDRNADRLPDRKADRNPGLIGARASASTSLTVGLSPPGFLTERVGRVGPDDSVASTTTGEQDARTC